MYNWHWHWHCHWFSFSIDSYIGTVQNLHIHLDAVRQVFLIQQLSLALSSYSIRHKWSRPYHANTLDLKVTHMHIQLHTCNQVFVQLACFSMVWLGGYWHQRADERLGDPPPRWIQEPLVVRNRDGRPPRGPSGSALLLNIRLRNDLYCVEWDVKLYYTILCFCVCSGSALLGDLLRISRSRERDLLSVL